MRNVEVAVSKRKPWGKAGRASVADSLGDTWRHAVDTKLASLYRAALEEPIPDDMLRLVGLIDAQNRSES